MQTQVLKSSLHIINLILLTQKSAFKRMRKGKLKPVSRSVIGHRMTMPYSYWLKKQTMFPLKFCNILQIH